MATELFKVWKFFARTDRTLSLSEWFGRTDLSVHPYPVSQTHLKKHNAHVSGFYSYTYLLLIEKTNHILVELMAANKYPGKTEQKEFSLKLLINSFTRREIKGIDVTLSHKQLGIASSLGMFRQN